ncbi:hypothetical protein Tcan_00624, partial [Toxocara canis]
MGHPVIISEKDLIFFVFFFLIVIGQKHLTVNVPLERDWLCCTRAHTAVSSSRASINISQISSPFAPPTFSSYVCCTSKKSFCYGLPENECMFRRFRVRAYSQ